MVRRDVAARKIAAATSRLEEAQAIFARPREGLAVLRRFLRRAAERAGI